MAPASKRFAIILVCTFVAFFVADGLVKLARINMLKRRVERVYTGMTEIEAIKLIGVESFPRTNGESEILVIKPFSLFDRLILQESTLTGWSIVIHSGKVVEVNTLMIWI